MYEDGRTYKQKRYRDIVSEQTLISYTINGISFEDTDYMSPYDRDIILETLKEIREAEKEAYEKAANGGSSNRSSRSTSRFK